MTVNEFHIYDNIVVYRVMKFMPDNVYACRFIAIASTTVETNSTKAAAVAELAAGIALMGKVMQRFDSVYELFEPVEDGRRDKCFISKSYDATR
jgi:RAB protein geranylgeranyltransferase component A